MFWGTGTTQYHPRPCVEAIARFEFPEDLLERYGKYIPIEQITKDDIQGLFADNYARIHGIDLDAVKKGIEGDEFSGVTELDAPWSNAREIEPGHAGAVVTAATPAAV